MPNMDSERRSKSKNGSRSAPRSRPQILVKSWGCPAKYCQVESNVVSELNVSYRNMVCGNISRIVKGFHMVIVNIAKGELIKKITFVKVDNDNWSYWHYW